MVDIANLRIVVDLDPAGVARGALASTAAINGFVRSTQAGLSRLGSAFTGLTAGQRAFAGTATVATLVGTALVSVARQAIEFESAFAGVEKTVSGTPAQLASIRDGLIDLSTVLPTSASELAGIAESAGQLGVQAPNVLEFTEVVAKLGETTDLSFEGAATSLARFLNITDGGVQNIEDAANVLVDLGNNSATTESQILNFSQRLAGAFTTAGATQEEIQAVAATFSSLGIEAEAGGSALSRVITQISDAALTGSDDLTTFAMVAGLTEQAFAALATDDPVEAFRRFELGLRDIIDSGGSITPILNQLGLDGLRVADALRRGALGADILTSSLNRADSALAEGTALNTEYANRVETTAAQLAILRDRLTAVAITAGTPLLGTLSDGAQLAGDAIERLVDLIAPLAGTLGNTFGNLASAAGTFFDVLGSPVLQASVGILNGVATALNLVLTAFNALGPAGAVLAPHRRRSHPGRSPVDHGRHRGRCTVGLTRQRRRVWHHRRGRRSSVPSCRRRRPLHPGRGRHRRGRGCVPRRPGQRPGPRRHAQHRTRRRSRNRGTTKPQPQPRPPWPMNTSGPLTSSAGRPRSRSPGYGSATSVASSPPSAGSSPASAPPSSTPRQPSTPSAGRCCGSAVRCRPSRRSSPSSVTPSGCPERRRSQWPSSSGWSNRSSVARRPGSVTRVIAVNNYADANSIIAEQLGLTGDGPPAVRVVGR